VGHDNLSAEMIETGPAKEPDVVLAFLRAEIEYSPNRPEICRWLQYFRTTKQELIDDADLTVEYQNAVRAFLLDCYRGYLKRDIFFKGFPTKVNWRRVELESTDFERLLYIANEPSWDRNSQKTRLPQLVADRIARGELPDLAPKVAAIRARLERNEALPELVAVEGEGNSLVLMEGAHRVTAYVSLKWKTKVPAIIGSSPLIHNWHWYSYR
jgi:hypothetical protein